MSLIRPPGATRIGDLIIDKGSPEEEQERGALERFFDSLIYGAGPSGGVSNEFPFPSYTPPSREGSFGTGFLPAIASTTTPPADENILSNIVTGVTGAATAATDKAKSAADTLLSQIKDFFPFYDQAQLVLNPVTGTGNIVFGTPPAGQPVIQAGQLPRSNTNVGVTTGVPILDQAINSVLSKPGGLDSGSIRDSVIDIIAKQSGLDPATTATILGKDLETILATANADVANTAARVGVNLTGEKKDDVIKTDAPALTNTVVKDDAVDIVTGTGDTSVVTGTGDSAIKTGANDAVDIVTGTGDTSVVTGAGDSSVVTGSLTPADLGEDTTVKTGTGDSVIKTGGGGGGGGGGGVATPTPSQGMRMESTEKAGLADINSTFDLDSTFVENLMRALSGKDDTGSEGSYYSGGKVAPYAGVDEIIRLLRG